MSRNFGQASALMAGYRHVHGDIVVSLDDDGQTPPAEMFRLIDALDEDTDVVYASYPSKHHSAFRNFGSRVNDWMATWLMASPRTSTWPATMRPGGSSSTRWSNATIPSPMWTAWPCVPPAGSRISPSTTRTVRKGRAAIPSSSCWGLAQRFTAFSVKPLRVATVMGVAFSLIGFLFAVIIVVRKIILLDQIDAGWSSIVAIVLLLDGILMMMLGLVGEYVGRMYMTMNKSPQYVIRSTTAAPGQPETKQ